MLQVCGDLQKPQTYWSVCVVHMHAAVLWRWRCFGSDSPALYEACKKQCVSLPVNVLTPLLSLCVLFQVLCNGPGTCVPLCVAGLLLGILGMKKVLIVYVESICRVQTLSLTGKILYPISDYFFVQWSSLRDKYPKSIFLGRIVWKHLFIRDTKYTQM